MDLKSYLELGKAFISGFFGAACFILIYQALQSTVPEIGSVNVNRLVNDHIKQRAQSVLSEKDLQIDSQQFMTRLEKVMHEIAKRQHLHLIVSDAVITGPKDYTETVRRRLEVTP